MTFSSICSNILSELERNWFVGSSDWVWAFLSSCWKRDFHFLTLSIIHKYLGPTRHLRQAPCTLDCAELQWVWPSEMERALYHHGRNIWRPNRLPNKCPNVWSWPPSDSSLCLGCRLALCFSSPVKWINRELWDNPLFVLTRIRSAGCCIFRLSTWKGLLFCPAQVLL